MVVGRRAPAHCWLLRGWTVRPFLDATAVLRYLSFSNVLTCFIKPTGESSVPPARLLAAMADVSERKLQLSVLLAFVSGVLVGWQANRLRRRYLDWRKRRLQDKLAVMQKKLDLS